MVDQPAGPARAGRQRLAQSLRRQLNGTSGAITRTANQQLLQTMNGASGDLLQLRAPPGLVQFTASMATSEYFFYSRERFPPLALSGVVSHPPYPMHRPLAHLHAHVRLTPLAGGCSLHRDIRSALLWPAPVGWQGAH